ncbi:MAG: prepilin-type N-terminal cleavage/methylation domain-containing protein [Betaproteobacteria bacterium CG2_30_59_46]|nr:MAG: prepilin-type N-terminal cleavage/methylation domain-containing protein [Betaproteobacteria bacterium CG2_30_59_46]PIQ13925.1 MAG: prepilin-type cleavage/methylation domain-containing protein [Hydrogenophilales bacterium CG18_big_fil_WC_8_21_14_2_50_58_12]PIY00629.1 MAG: prepilin-type cleavage/methylation domain-containing protein [Hydrogenophilales bacterium CG_4_10_14_3_um_filter_58_23]PJB07091.1 MAG: prepilin-type cleavage/methylation domain-containing protein [Hydrogenophilales bacte
MKFKNTAGFTLIELMIAVAIVGILAAVALPNYQQYIIRGNRAAAQAQMMDIANLEQQYILANRVYTATGSDLGYALPSEVSARYGYSITVDNVGPPPSFTITFTPTVGTPQAGDGTLVLTSAGVKTRAGDASKW